MVMGAKWMAQVLACYLDTGRPPSLLHREIIREVPNLMQRQSPTSTAAISLAGRTPTAQHRPDVFERQAGHWAEVLEYLMESCGEEL